MANDKDILVGWKDIEDFIGLKREAIVACGFPVRKGGKAVMAVKTEILDFILTLPLVSYKPTINDENRQ